MKINKIGEAKIIMSNFGSKHNTFGWPTAKRLKNGRIAVAASGFRRRHVCPFGKTVISFSENDGETYTLPAPVIDTVLDDRDGGLCTFGESGLIVTSFNLPMKMQRELNVTYSENGWMDWDTQPKEMGKYIDAYLDTVTPEEEEEAFGITYRVSYDNGVTFGDIMKSPVTSPHGPIELQDGSILWVGTKRNDLRHLESYKMGLDGTFEKLGEISRVEFDENTVNAEPYAIQLKDGKIICHLRVDPQFTLFQTVSEDNGRTWSEPERLFEDGEGIPSHILEHSSGLLIATYGHRKAPWSIRAMFSKDKGKTWDYGYEIFTNNNVPEGIDIDMGYPSTVELSDGSLITVFYMQTDPSQPSVIMQQKWSIE